MPQERGIHPGIQQVRGLLNKASVSGPFVLPRVGILLLSPTIPPSHLKTHTALQPHHLHAALHTCSGPHISTNTSASPASTPGRSALCTCPLGDCDAPLPIRSACLSWALWCSLEHLPHGSVMCMVPTGLPVSFMTLWDGEQQR